MKSKSSPGLRSPIDVLASTRTLILRVNAGDDAARNELCRRFLPGLRRWAHGRLPSAARGLVETDDIVQISLVRALSRLGSFDARSKGAFLGYLHQTLLNCMREEIRRASRRPARGADPIDLPEERPALLVRTLGSAHIDAYERALAELPDLQQQAVILRVEFGFSFKEIADALGRPSDAAARMMVVRAVVRLAEVMDE
jgi:RNA polymerase sigma-70 factor (ECF subfamily)